MAASPSSPSSNRALHSPPKPSSQANGLPVPDDIGLYIASFLEASDLCSLGSCSRQLRDLCAADFLWASLFSRRWPSVDFESLGSSNEKVVEDAPAGSSSSSQHGLGSLPSAQGWKKVYEIKFKRLSVGISSVIKFVNGCSQNESLEVGDFLKAIENLTCMDPGFEDVKFFMISEKQSVIVNLIGVQYSMCKLQVPGDVVREALMLKQVSERKVCIFSFRIGRWFFGFRLPDERTSCVVSLGDFTTSKETSLRSMLGRGAIHGVLRVQITSASSENTW